MLPERTCRVTWSNLASEFFQQLMQSFSSDTTVNRTRTVEDIGHQIQNLQSESLFKRAVGFTKDPERIDDMRKQFDEAVTRFQVCD